MAVGVTGLVVNTLIFRVEGTGFEPQGGTWPICDALFAQTSQCILNFHSPAGSTVCLKSIANAGLAIPGSLRASSGAKGWVTAGQVVRGRGSALAVLDRQLAW